VLTSLYSELSSPSSRKIQQDTIYLIWTQFIYLIFGGGAGLMSVVLSVSIVKGWPKHISNQETSGKMIPMHEIQPLF